MAADRILISRLVKRAPPQGDYRATGLDAIKASAQFLVTAVGAKTSIRWADGRVEAVSDSKLARLQAAHTWATDF